MKTSEGILRDTSITVDKLKQEKPLLFHNIIKAMEKYASQFKEQKEEVKEGEGCKHKNIRKGMHPYCASGQMWCSDCKQYFNLTQPNK